MYVYNYIDVDFHFQAEATDITFSHVARIAGEFGGSVVDHNSKVVVIAWPDVPESPLRLKNKAAVTCAFKIAQAVTTIKSEHEKQTKGGARLQSMTCGIGCGTLSLLVCGGCLGRLYCIPTGPAYADANYAIAAAQVR